MRNENAFNAWLSKEFRSRHNRLGFFHVKASDKFTVGVSDFLLWMNSRSAGLETKFVKTIDRKPDTLLLDHTFTGPQLTFLESMRLTGNRGYGLLGVDDTSEMLLINSAEIPADGNWTALHFKQTKRQSFDMDDVDGLLNAIFL